MSTQPPNVRLSESVLVALQERAEQENKSADELASELVMAGLHNRENRTARLLALIEYGHRYAEETHPGLDEQAVVEIVRNHRRR